MEYQNYQQEQFKQIILKAIGMILSKKHLETIKVCFKKGQIIWTHKTEDKKCGLSMKKYENKGTPNNKLVCALIVSYKFLILEIDRLLHKWINISVVLSTTFILCPYISPIFVFLNIENYLYKI